MPGQSLATAAALARRGHEVTLLLPQGPADPALTAADLRAWFGVEGDFRVVQRPSRWAGERLHRTLWAEVVGMHDLPDLATAQRRFDAWRTVYNQQRPHEALDYAVPADRYQPSPRPFPREAPPIVYGPDDWVRQVYAPGCISFRNREVFISHGLIGRPVAVRPTPAEAVVTVWYGPRQVATLDLTDQN